MQYMVAINQNDLDALDKAFPALCRCKHFDVLDYPDLLYNCIAYAMGTDQMWVSPYRDAPWVWWPDTCPFTMEPDSLVQAFQALGFEKCIANNVDNEDGYEKAILYQNGGLWTHASRVTGIEECESKLGESWKVQHDRGEVFVGSIYGTIYAVMKRPVRDAHITQDNVPQRVPASVDRAKWSDYVKQIKQLNRMKYGRFTAMYCGHDNSIICGFQFNV